MRKTVVVVTYTHLIKRCSGKDLCLLHFVKLELCADQTVGELAHLSLLLGLAVSQLVLCSGQLFIGRLQHQA